MQAANVRNLFAQLNSIYEVGSLWEEYQATRKYHAVIFARPDVEYVCEFPAQMLKSLQV
jgi:hypothetical protein